MPRQMMKKSVDRKVFRRSAVQTKAVNLGTVMYRGGIRF